VRIKQTDCQETIFAIINRSQFAESAFPVLLADALGEHPRVAGTNGRFCSGGHPEPQHRFDGRLTWRPVHAPRLTESGRMSARNGNSRRYSSKDAKSSSALRQHSSSPASANISPCWSTRI